MCRRWIAAALALTLLLCTAGAAEVENIANQCQYLVSEGTGANITDDSMNTAWVPRGDSPELRIKLPDGGAAYIQIHWSIPPTNYTLTEYAEDQSVIATHTQDDDEFACIAELLPLNKATRYVFLNFHQSGQGVNKIRVFPEGELPKTVVKWEPPLEKCELLIISTHQDDEWLWFGPMIPYYDLVKKRDVQVMYMANCGRHRYAEALNALAVAGVRTFPMFLGLKDEYNGSIPASIKVWKSTDYLLERVVEQIRRFKPEIILTHDILGEYGHPQHILTSRCMQRAIELAADPEQFPESAQEYGAWQVKKLYRHLEKKGQIQFDWHVAYPEFGGRTGIQVAIDSMNENVTQTDAWQVEDHGEYDNSLFGLSYSVVGDDVLHEDLFENISDSTAAPEAAETVAPEAVETVALEAVAPEVPAAREKETGAGIAPGIIVGVAVVVCIGALGAWFVAGKRRRPRRKRGAAGAKKMAGAKKTAAGSTKKKPTAGSAGGGKHTKRTI